MHVVLFVGRFGGPAVRKGVMTAESIDAGDAGDLGKLRLGYAQHVYRQQGATVEHAIVLTGGWQTSRETAYVEATRARHGTDWYLARDKLGQEGHDVDCITRLAEKMSSSREQTPSIVHETLPDLRSKRAALPQARHEIGQLDMEPEHILGPSR